MRKENQYAIMISENNESCAEMGNSMNERIKVIVMSRLEAYQYCKKHHDKPSAIISISTPYNIYDYCVFKSGENQVIDILELSFVDADEPESLDLNYSCTSGTASANGCA